MQLQAWQPGQVWATNMHLPACSQRARRLLSDQQCHASARPAPHLSKQPPSSRLHLSGTRGAVALKAPHRTCASTWPCVPDPSALDVAMVSLQRNQGADSHSCTWCVSAPGPNLRLLSLPGVQSPNHLVVMASF